jgi:DNA-damage-inducible protein D
MSTFAALEKTRPTAGSPFDPLRHTTPGGREYWSAREVMALLSYSQWRDFANAITRARAAAHNAGHDTTQHFASARKVAASGPAAEDAHLSRYACYLVAMNADPKKAAVADAQTYFAMRTRESELAEATDHWHADAHPIPQTYADALRAAADQAERAERAEGLVAELEPSATAWDRLAELGADFEVADAAKILSRDPNIEIGRNRLFEFMHEHDWVFRGRHNAWKAYQDAVDAGRLRLRPGGEYFHPPSGQYRLGDPVLVITPKGLAELRRLLGGGAQLALVMGGEA